MEYGLIVVFEFCGILFSVGQKVAALNKQTTQQDTIPHILRTYVRQDFVTIALSGVIIIMNLAFHFVIGEWGGGFVTRVFGDIDTYKVFSMAFAFFLGWGGQAFFYRMLGKAELYLHKKTDDILSK